MSRASVEAELGQMGRTGILIESTLLLILDYLFLVKPKKVTGRTNRSLSQDSLQFSVSYANQFY